MRAMAIKVQLKGHNKKKEPSIFGLPSRSVCLAVFLFQFMKVNKNKCSIFFVFVRISHLPNKRTGGRRPNSNYKVPFCHS